MHGLSGIANETVEWRLHREGHGLDVPESLKLVPFPRLLGTVNIDATAMAPSPKVAARTCVILLEAAPESDFGGTVGMLSSPEEGIDAALGGLGAALIDDPRVPFQQGLVDESAIASALENAVQVATGDEPVHFSHRQKAQMSVFAGWFTLLAEAFATSGGNLNAPAAEIAASNALLHFGMASLPALEFSAMLKNLESRLDSLLPAAADDTLGSLLAPRIESLVSSGGGLAMSGRALDFWDRLS